MNKKHIHSRLFILLLSSIMHAGYDYEDIPVRHYRHYKEPVEDAVVKNRSTVPYEDVIAREFNRMRGGVNKYTSIEIIMNQTLRGKSIEQKTQIITDIQSLKHAVHAALEQAKHDGKRMWFWFYIWKDNEPAIQTLAQYGFDIEDRLAELEWETQPDYYRAGWYITKYTTAAVAAVVALYVSQHKLSKEFYTEHGHHGIVEMLAAPLLVGYDIAKEAGKYTVLGVNYISGALAHMTNYEFKGKITNPITTQAQ